MKFFSAPNSVDSVLSTMTQAIDRLEALELDKADEADVHAKTIADAKLAQTAALSESIRASSVRRKLAALISA